MIIHTGMRTDIPSFYSRWLMNRIREGYVLVRNPYNRKQVTRYELDPEKVDLLCFCTKNPGPMVPYLAELDRFHQYWHVTITPYGRNIEPHVRDKNRVMEDFKAISDHVGKASIAWRYDPIFIYEKYTVDYHTHMFEEMARRLQGYTDTCIISFVDRYEKVKKNFPQVKEVTREEMLRIGRAFLEIGEKYGIAIRPCAEGKLLEPMGADCTGCMSQSVLERSLGRNLNVPSGAYKRGECGCLLGGDIGEYNTCGHLCRYCYANYSEKLVRENMRLHDPDSPLLTGYLEEGDVIHEAKQESWIENQLSLFLMKDLEK